LANYSKALVQVVANYLNTEKIEHTFEAEKGRFQFEKNLSWRLNTCKSENHNSK
jgi:hypothetical protein